jgi:acetyl-CoA carboxylase, biotin carboxylase subunit
VEHPVTEMVTGVDIVEQQLRLAAGEPLSPRQEDVHGRGAAVECRLNAEDPARDFQATPGVLEVFRMPGGPFTRVDTHCVPGATVSPYYDPLLAKVVTWGADRPAALRRMERAMAEVRVEGPGLRSNTGLLREVLAEPDFAAGAYSTQLLTRMLGRAVPGTAR